MTQKKANMYLATSDILMDMRNKFYFKLGLKIPNTFRYN